jgi:hypothetical protein
MPTIRAFFDASRLTLIPTGSSGSSFHLVIDVQGHKVTLRAEFNGRFYITLDEIAPCVPEPLIAHLQEIVMNEEAPRSLRAHVHTGLYRSNSRKASAQVTEILCAGTVYLRFVVRAKSLQSALDFHRQVLSGQAGCSFYYGRRDEGVGSLRRRQPETH